MPMSPRCWPPNLDVDWLVNSDSIHPASGPAQSKIALGKWMIVFFIGLECVRYGWIIIFLCTCMHSTCTVHVYAWLYTCTLNL